jgi:hypothetical protein
MMKKKLIIFNPNKKFYPREFYLKNMIYQDLIFKVNSTTKCNFDKCLVAKDVLVSKASRPASQSRHDLSTP